MHDSVLFHDHSQNGDRQQRMLLCTLLAITRATKLILSNHTKPY